MFLSTRFNPAKLGTVNQAALFVNEVSTLFANESGMGGKREGECLQSNETRRDETKRRRAERRGEERIEWKWSGGSNLEFEIEFKEECSLTGQNRPLDLHKIWALADVQIEIEIELDLAPCQLELFRLIVWEKGTQLEVAQSFLSWPKVES